MKQCPINQFQINIAPGGVATMIYSDAHKGFFDQADSVEVTRASHVEPDGKGFWEADMSPVGGGMLGPFLTRAEALKEEVKWLNRNILR